MTTPTPQSPRERFALGFELYSLSLRPKQLLAEHGNQILTEFVAAVIAHGTSFIHDIEDAVTALVGDERLNDKLTELLDEQEGQLWERYRHPETTCGPFYRLL